MKQYKISAYVIETIKIVHVLVFGHSKIVKIIWENLVEVQIERQNLRCASLTALMLLFGKSRKQVIDKFSKLVNDQKYISFLCD